VRSALRSLKEKTADSRLLKKHQEPLQQQKRRRRRLR
jgi:hypothetical protein